MARADYSIPTQGDVDWEVAFPATPGGTTPGTYDDLGCLIGAVQVSDSTDAVTVELGTWCEQQAGNALQESTDGTRSIQISATVAVETGSQVFQDLMENRDIPNEPIWLRGTRRNRLTNVTSWVQEYRGRTRQANVNDPDGNSISDVALQVEVFEKISDSFDEAGG